MKSKKIGHLYIMHVRQAALCVFSPDMFSVVTVYNVYILPDSNHVVAKFKKYNVDVMDHNALQ
jgi:hypothetical protein